MTTNHEANSMLGTSNDSSENLVAYNKAQRRSRYIESVMSTCVWLRAMRQLAGELSVGRLAVLLGDLCADWTSKYSQLRECAHEESRVFDTSVK